MLGRLQELSALEIAAEQMRIWNNLEPGKINHVLFVYLHNKPVDLSTVVGIGGGGITVISL